MNFWRNESTETFDPNGAGRRTLETALQSALASPQCASARAMQAFLGALAFQVDPAGSSGHDVPWAVQEVCWNVGTFSANFVIPKDAKRVVNSVVGGGLGVCIETNGHISAEFVLYCHRLICTNGMTRKMQASGRIEAEDLREWTTQVERTLPAILAGSLTGFETLGRSALVRLGLLRPMVPVVLNYLEVPEPENRLILDAFAAEPGDTLFHFVNAFSRAANLVMLEHGLEPEVALRKRRQLQSASWRVCEDALAFFTDGSSILDAVRNLRGVLSP